jgi:hypothetical protein
LALGSKVSSWQPVLAQLIAEQLVVKELRLTQDINGRSLGTVVYRLKETEWPTNTPIIAVLGAGSTASPCHRP